MTGRDLYGVWRSWQQTATPTWEDLTPQGREEWDQTARTLHTLMLYGDVRPARGRNQVELVRWNIRAMEASILRDNYGNRLTISMGEPDTYGIFTPTFNVQSDSWLRQTIDAETRLLRQELEAAQQANQRLTEVPATLLDRVRQLSEATIAENESPVDYATRIQTMAIQMVWSQDDISYLCANWAARKKNEGREQERRHPLCFACGQCRLWTDDRHDNDCSCLGPCQFDSWESWLATVIEDPDRYRSLLSREDH